MECIYLQYKMFLLNIEESEDEEDLFEFTIQNVSIKLDKEKAFPELGTNLQYKMFLLNLIFLKLPI